MKKTIPLIIALVLCTAGYLNAAPAAENWENSCAKCHGSDGKADTKIGKKLKIRDYTDKASLANVTDEELIKATAEGVTVDGKERMKGYASEYSTEEIAEMVKLIRSFAK